METLKDKLFEYSIMVRKKFNMEKNYWLATNFLSKIVAQ